jgi:hypothetical protein
VIAIEDRESLQIEAEGSRNLHRHVEDNRRLFRAVYPDDCCGQNLISAGLLEWRRDDGHGSIGAIEDTPGQRAQEARMSECVNSTSHDDHVGVHFVCGSENLRGRIAHEQSRVVGDSRLFEGRDEFR